MSTKTTVLANKKIAVEPFSSAPSGPQIVGGFAVVASKNSLVPLKVVFDSWSSVDKLSRGSKVYTTSDTADQPFAKVVYEMNGEKFILVPEERIILYEQE